MLGFMGGIGMSELLVVLGIALLIFGASRIPEIARSLGKAMNEFKKARQEPDDKPAGKPENEAPTDEEKKS